jgi:hypothetical protein
LQAAAETVVAAMATVTATSGSITHIATFILNVKQHAKTPGEKGKYDEDQIQAVLRVAEQLADGAGSDK